MNQLGEFRKQPEMMRRINVMQRKSIRAYVVFLVIIFVVCELCGATSTFEDFTKGAFYKFVTEPNVTVSRVKFRKEVFISEVPEGARNQVFLLKKVGDDYLLSVLSGTNDESSVVSAGMYKGRSWGVTYNEITFSDRSLNETITPIAAQESVTRLTGNLVLSLGIMELIRGSLIWDEKNSLFIGKSTSGGDLVIRFELSDHLPKRAIIQDGFGGHEIAYIDYEYSKDLGGGALPYRFTRYFGSPENNQGRSFRVELLEADLTPNQVAQIILDPMAVFHPKTVSFYSNNMVWTVEASGKVTKPMTIAEYQRSLNSKQPNKSFATRTIVVMTIGFGVVVLVFSLVREKNKKNRKT